MSRKNETVTMKRSYRGFEIRTVVQDSGRKTYDIYYPIVVRESGDVYYPDGHIMEGGAESLRVARAIVDAELD